MEYLEAIEKMKTLKGLSNVFLLSDLQKEKVIELEEIRNIGVKLCAEKKHCIVCTHDSTFPEPKQSIVMHTMDGAIFPAIKFPEIIESISSSPGIKVHEYLVKEFDMRLIEEDATLLIGLD